MDFGPILDRILKVIPQERTTYLFSATMTTKVAKLQRASLSNPVRVEVNEKCVSVLECAQFNGLIVLLQVFYCINPTPILPLHTTSSKGRPPDIPRQLAGTKLYHHLHEDGA